MAAENQQPELPPRYRLARIGLAAATALISVNLWTGAPLLSIWVGSRVQGGTGLTMGAVGAVLGTLGITVAILVYLLVRVEAAYKFFNGEPVDQRRTAPWMRSLRDERAEFIGVKRKLSGFEKTLIAVVLVAGGAVEVWFFFFAGSSIGSS